MSLKQRIGTVGLGLMGSSIATCMLAAGHEVTSLVKDESEAEPARKRILGYLMELHDEGMLKESPETVAGRITITTNIADLVGHEVVIESITEDVEAKKAVYHALETVLSNTAIIGSNTSAIPVSVLQAGLWHPERLLGIHWAEPAHITRFMEVICGKDSDLKYAQRIVQLAESWGKEPSLLRKDIRGFITNRIMYAMLREAFNLVENGYATVEDVDRGAIGIAAPLMTAELNLDPEAFGLILSAFFWVYAPVQLIVGWLCDRFSVYRLMAGGVLLWALATLATERAASRSDWEATIEAVAARETDPLTAAESLMDKR